MQQKLRSKWGEYLAFQNLKYKFDTEKAGVFLGIILGITFTVLPLAFLDCYTSFNEEEIRINKFFDLGATHYQFEEVDKIECISSTRENGNKFKYINIHFTDGYMWHSVDAGFNNYEKDFEIVHLIQRHVDLEVTQVSKVKD